MGPAWPSQYLTSFAGLQAIECSHGKWVIKIQQLSNKNRRRRSYQLFLGKFKTLLSRLVWPAESEEPVLITWEDHRSKLCTTSGPDTGQDFSEGDRGRPPSVFTELLTVVLLITLWQQSNPESMINSRHIIRREGRSKYSLQSLHPLWWNFPIGDLADDLIWCDLGNLGTTYGLISAYVDTGPFWHWGCTPTMATTPVSTKYCDDLIHKNMM